MKVGFVGTHGTGKTTDAYALAHHLKLHGYDVKVLTGAARDCPLPINEQATLESQMWIFAEILRREIESKADITICDRTVLDTFAYLYRLFPQESEQAVGLALLWFNTYDVVFWKRTTEYLCVDGVRPTDKQFQLDIDAIIEKFIRQYQLFVIEENDAQKQLEVVERHYYC